VLPSCIAIGAWGARVLATKLPAPAQGAGGALGAH
jgi:hypothetical protein